MSCWNIYYLTTKYRICKEDNNITWYINVNSQYHSVKKKRFKFTFLRCFEKYMSLFFNKSWHSIKKLQNKKLQNHARSRTIKIANHFFWLQARSGTLYERSPSVHELFNTIVLSAITLLLLYICKKKDTPRYQKSLNECY